MRGVRGEAWGRGVRYMRVSILGLEMSHQSVATYIGAVVSWIL